MSALARATVVGGAAVLGARVLFGQEGEKLTKEELSDRAQRLDLPGDSLDTLHDNDNVERVFRVLKHHPDADSRLDFLQVYNAMEKSNDQKKLLELLMSVGIKGRQVRCTSLLKQYINEKKRGVVAQENARSIVKGLSYLSRWYGKHAKRFVALLKGQLSEKNRDIAMMFLWGNDHKRFIDVIVRCFGLETSQSLTDHVLHGLELCPSGLVSRYCGRLKALSDERFVSFAEDLSALKSDEAKVREIRHLLATPEQSFWSNLFGGG